MRFMAVHRSGEAALFREMSDLRFHIVLSVYAAAQFKTNATREFKDLLP
jgi:hypothetical protein